MTQLKTSSRGLPALLLGLALAGTPHAARAQDDSPPATKAELAKLQAEVREQRSLIIQMLQTEQQRYDMLLRLLQSQQGGAAVPVPELPGPAAAEPAPPETPTAARRSRGGAGAEREAERRIVNGTIEGKVSVSGGDLGDVYVYVENLKTPPARGKSIEIRQEGKQFAPRVAVVQTGTTVYFPNFDAIYHNVFSSSARNAFDLGSYRSGDKPRSVTFTAPGVVDVFCNMHQKMSAAVLVVPNTFYTKVKPDGSFRLDNVPAGARKLVAWGPHARASHQKVDVTAGATHASFALEYEERAPHANKVGQAYGSYRD
jgi:plastocyanin